MTVVRPHRSQTGWRGENQPALTDTQKMDDPQRLLLPERAAGCRIETEQRIGIRRRHVQPACCEQYWCQTVQWGRLCIGGPPRVADGPVPSPCQGIDGDDCAIVSAINDLRAGESQQMMTIARLADLDIAGFTNVAAPSQRRLASIVGGVAVDGREAAIAVVARGRDPDQSARDHRSAFKNRIVVCDAANVPTKMLALAIGLE